MKLNMSVQLKMTSVLALYEAETETFLFVIVASHITHIFVILFAICS